MDYSERFEEWWRAYPRRVGKRKAYLKWQNAIARIADERETTKNEAADWLLSRTQVFASSSMGHSGQFCPYPATWLYQGRYDDDEAEWGVADWNDGPWTAQ